jgi:hypothetical protein
MSVDPAGVVITHFVSGFFDQRNVDIRYANGRVYTTNGYVIDPVNSTAVKAFAAQGSSVLPDPNSGKVFYATFRGIEAYSLPSLSFIGIVPASPAGVFSLVAWGATGLAYKTGSNAIFILNLVPPPTPIPTPAPVGGIVELRAGGSDSPPSKTTEPSSSTLPIALVGGAALAVMVIGWCGARRWLR